METRSSGGWSVERLPGGAVQDVRLAALAPQLEAGAVLSVRVNETYQAHTGAPLADVGPFYARLHRCGLFGELSELR